MGLVDLWNRGGCRVCGIPGLGIQPVGWGLSEPHGLMCRSWIPGMDSRRNIVGGGWPGWEMNNGGIIKVGVIGGGGRIQRSGMDSFNILA